MTSRRNQTPTEPATGAAPLFEILFEDTSLLVINKPAGLVCHPTKQDERSSLIGRVRLHLGNDARPHLINRLDRETSGVTVAAKNAETAGQLGKIWESRAVTKTYLAIVHGHVGEASGVIDAPLGKDERSAVVIKDCVRPDGASAQTEFWVERHFSRLEGDFSVVRLMPRTGRKHQLRIHLAHLGHPIVGDKIYGGDEQIYLDFVRRRLTEPQRHRLLLINHALHAVELRFNWRGSAVAFTAEPDEEFANFLPPVEV